MKAYNFINSESGRQGISLILLVAIFSLLVSPIFTAPVKAAPLTEASIRLDRMGGGIAANTTTARILVVAKPASTATEARVTITWPTTSAFTVSATAADHTEAVTDLPSTYQGESLTAWPGIDTATAVAGGAVTFPSSDLTAGTLYGFYITGGITNPAAGDAGTHTVTIATETSAPATIDSSSIAVDTVGTNGDQVTVTATVPATFNFAIADNALPLGTLSTSAVAANSMSSAIDVDTNAANGWIAWIRSEGAGRALTSGTTSYDIDSTDTGSPVTCVSGTDCYVIDAASAAGGGSTGVVTEATEYAGNGTTSGGVIGLTYEEISSSDGPAANDTITLTAIAAISGIVPAASDYTDTLEVVGAGNF